MKVKPRKCALCMVIVQEAIGLELIHHFVLKSRARRSLFIIKNRHTDILDMNIT